ncbi:hypothetical protein LSH36_894g01003 [Paralvinella palmiformis]|uniref:Uncharacterized protein n=1 Tax=Paralvinella palmiformis TaxID=53620 RepID=A0AAD9IYZ9_9ANNE|nr:hypothetical protein LSH36_894g01003 [Paralvinella palmiformis]
MRSTGSTLAGIGDYFRNGAATSAPRPAAPVAAQPFPAPAASSRFGCGGKQTLIAEVLWAMKCVESHYPFHSCEGISVLFQQMFQGHPIAETFSCGETKCRYICQFGLAPHFSSLLKSRINKYSEYVRLWHHDQVHTRYLTSQFIGHGAATDVLQHFNASTSDIRRNGLLQTGSRETGCGLDGLLSSPYYLFKDTPARRDDFTDVTGCNEFPLKFCKHRVDGDDVDMLVASYKGLLHDLAGCELKSRFKDFKVEDNRVNMLLYECMDRNKKFEKLW